MNWGRLRGLVILAAVLAAGSAFGASGDKAEVNAVVLDHNEFPCTNCLFGIGDYYFCFDANNKILIGHDKVRTQMWKKTPVDLLERGKKVALRFDDKSIWVSRPGHKDLKLKQDYSKKIFLNSDRCEAAVKGSD